MIITFKTEHLRQRSTNPLIFLNYHLFHSPHFILLFLGSYLSNRPFAPVIIFLHYLSCFTPPCAAPPYTAVQFPVLSHPIQSRLAFLCHHTTSCPVQSHPCHLIHSLRLLPLLPCPAFLPPFNPRSPLLPSLTFLSFFSSLISNVTVIFTLRLKY